MPDEALTRDHVVWAYRLLLDRDPESEEAITPKLHAWRTAKELRTDIMSSAEFKLKNPDAAQVSHSTIVIKPLASGARLCIDLSDHVIGLAILRDRYEVDEVAFALSQLRPGDVAIDVGAHIGFFAVQMAEAVGPEGAVYAFEPLERNAAMLERSIAENGFGPRLRLERAAVSSQSGTSRLHFAAETLNTGGAVLSEAAVTGLGALQSATVSTVRLDEYPCRRPVRLLKMDVEGSEPSVVDGARRLLVEDRPIIVSEVHAAQLARVSGAAPATFLAQLAALGYRPYRITPTGPGASLDLLDLDTVVTVAFLPE